KIDRITPLIEECSRLGVIVNPPSVNYSSVKFDVDQEGGIIYALSAIKNVGEGSSSAIVEAREKDGPFDSIFNLCTRLGNGIINKKAVESLIGAGAMDCFGKNRATLLDSVEHAISYGISVRRHIEAGQMSLFDSERDDSEENSVNHAPILKEKEELSLEEMYRLEKSLLGFYMTGHPLEMYSDEIDSFSNEPIELAHESDRKLITTAGMILKKKIIPTKHGEMAFVLVEGCRGTSEVVVFSDALKEFGDLLEPDSLVLMDGEVSRRRGDSRFSARKIFPLNKVRSILRAGVTIVVDGSNPRIDLLEKAVDCLRNNSGKGEVSVIIKHSSGWKVVGRSRSLRVDPCAELISELRELLGNESVALSRGRGPRL
ncbi:MAG: hypothetical protein KAW14_11475, partial [Candidatus Aegiribacteria sp.]|nr:hypothetical protein [Candidatus Aegiribacteria sp.]